MMDDDHATKGEEAGMGSPQEDEHPGKSNSEKEDTHKEGSHKGACGEGESGRTQWWK